MAFDFSDVKRITTGTIITRLAHSCAPWYKAYEKRVAADGDGRWPFVFYYYYLEKLIRKLQNGLDLRKAQWDTPTWNEVAALADDEPDIFEGLRRLYNLYSEHYPSEARKIKDTIEVLRPILAAK